ncbi:MAG: hypothetical protein IJ125_08875 [Atopobiaceae bacterium]|nr:hypothetical protein [Atopobiaceae bacterium]
MADLNFTDNIMKLFFAGVGAMANTMEKSNEIIEDLVKKGELTVEQGKSINEELTHKAQENFGDFDAMAIRTRLELMSAEKRTAYAEKVAKIVAELNERDTKPADAPEETSPEAAE